MINDKMTDFAMDYGWIKANFPEVFVKKGKMYIELDYELYKVLKRVLPVLSKEQIARNLCKYLGFDYDMIYGKGE